MLILVDAVIAATRSSLFSSRPGMSRTVMATERARSQLVDYFLLASSFRIAEMPDEYWHAILASGVWRVSRMNRPRLPRGVSVAYEVALALHLHSISWLFANLAYPDPQSCDGAVAADGSWPSMRNHP